MSQKQPTRIFGYWNGLSRDIQQVLVTAATEDGRPLLSYFVKTEEWGKWALGMDGKTRNNWEKYQAMVGPFVLEWVPFVETSTHRGLQMMLQRYRDRVIHGHEET